MQLCVAAAALTFTVSTSRYAHGARPPRSDQGRLQHVADRRDRAERPAASGCARNLARRRECGGRPARPSGRTRLLRRPEQPGERAGVYTRSCCRSTKSISCSDPIPPTWRRRRCRGSCRPARPRSPLLAIGVNRHFNYDRYFSMVPVGTEGVPPSRAASSSSPPQQKPKPTTVAMIAADAEFARTAADGAKENAAEARLQGHL